MYSVLHKFLQNLAAVVFLKFLFQLAFIKQITMFTTIVVYFQDIYLIRIFLLINEYLCFSLLIILTILYFIKYFIIKPAFLTNLLSIIYFMIGAALLGFLKLTIGEYNPFTVGFILAQNTSEGSQPTNNIKIIDYSTQYGCPNGLFYYLILLLNLILVRCFSYVRKTDDLIETKLPSRNELKQSQFIKKRRKSIDEYNFTETRRKSLDNLDFSFEDEYTPNKLESNLVSQRKFDLFEKEFSDDEKSADNLSQVDSNTSDVKSSSSNIFLKKFENVNKKSKVSDLLLRLKSNNLKIMKNKPQMVMFWMITYNNFKHLSNSILFYVAFIFFFSGYAYSTDLIFALLFAKIYSKFYFRVLERYFFHQI